MIRVFLLSIEISQIFPLLKVGEKCCQGSDKLSVSQRFPSGLNSLTAAPLAEVERTGRQRSENRVAATPATLWQLFATPIGTTHGCWYRFRG